MRYRKRVSIEVVASKDRSPTGVETPTWATLHANVPATITVTTTQETRASEMTSEEARYDIVLAGWYADIDSTHRVVDPDGNHYDIEFVDRALNLRQTRLVARLVTVPVAA